jgi:hypothetical protein
MLPAEVSAPSIPDIRGLGPHVSLLDAGKKERNEGIKTITMVRTHG